MIEFTVTEIFFFLWAMAATVAAVVFHHQFNMLSKLMYLLSTNKEMRKDFFTRYDTLFGDTK